jgi:exopolyphosphatase/guanosine-5'-triphosphate,3'-diphosphate pyrophosphatase
MERTSRAVAALVARARDAGAKRVRVAATSAVRDASNRDGFARAVRSASGVDLDVIAGEDEGRICFVGATHALDDGPFLVCDIGGGSTEFVRGGTYVEAVWSADVGSVRLRERYLTSDPPTAGEIRGAVTLIEHELLQVERDVGLVGDEQLVGVAGTVTSLAVLALGLDRYEPALVHHSRITREDVVSWTDKLLAMRASEVRELPTMQPGRADVIAAGALILRETMVRWGIEDVLVSEQDVLDGLVLEMVLGPDAGLPDVGDLA